MKNLVPIGRFSEICRLSRKALRLYDEQGLLTPAWVDPDSGYRYYAAAQVLEAERIRKLRALELPLDDVAELLRDPSAAGRVLDRHRRRLEARLDEVKALLSSLDHLETEEAMTYDVKTKDLSPQQIISIRIRSRLADLGAEAARAYRELFEHLGRSGAAPAGPPLAVYHSEPSEDDGLDVEFAVPVSRPMSGAGRICGRELGGGHAAVTLHCGRYDAVGPGYAALQQWIQAHGHEIVEGPREHYLVGPQQAADPSGFRTELQWPFR